MGGRATRSSTSPSSRRGPRSRSHSSRREWRGRGLWSAVVFTVSNVTDTEVRNAIFTNQCSDTEVRSTIFGVPVFEELPSSDFANCVELQIMNQTRVFKCNGSVFLGSWHGP